MEITDIEPENVAAASGEESPFRVKIDSRGVRIFYEGGWSVLMIRKVGDKWELARYTSLGCGDFRTNERGQIQLTRGG